MKSSCIDFVRLDFEGGLNDYRNAELGMDIVVPVAPSGIAPERRECLAEKLNQAGGNVRFVLDGEATSIIHIGKSNAFDAYGHFLGLAEGIGEGDAFVLLDNNASDEELVVVICHEAGHILGTLDHGGAGLARYGYLNQEYDYFLAPDPENPARRLYLKCKTTNRYEVNGQAATSTSGGLCLQTAESWTEIFYQYSGYEQSYNEETHQWY